MDLMKSPVKDLNTEGTLSVCSLLRTVYLRCKEVTNQIHPLLLIMTCEDKGEKTMDFPNIDI
jgi:hypothetical protein